MLVSTVPVSRQSESVKSIDYLDNLTISRLQSRLDSKNKQGCEFFRLNNTQDFQPVWSVCVTTEEAQQFEQIAEIDRQIQQLLQIICQHSNPTDLVRRRALNRFLCLVQKLPGICRSTHQDYPQALNRTWEWLSQNVDRFQPHLDASPFLVRRSLVNWINGYLKWRIRDLYVSDSQCPISLDRCISNEEGEQTTLKDLLPDQSFTPLTLDLLEIRIEKLQELQRQRFGQQIWQWIEQDSSQKLIQCHLRNRADCNCHILAKRLLLHSPPNRIADLARELDANNQTLYTHWKRQCLPLLKEIAQQFESAL